MKRSLPCVLAIASAAALTAGSQLSAAAAPDWPTFHHDNTRQGFDGQVAGFSSVSPGWSGALDGHVYAEPLVVGNHVFVATEHNSVYSFDATTGTQVWNFNAGAPVPNSQLAPGCGNVDPVGITGTPAIDPVGGHLFAVAQVAAQTYHLVELDISTGTPINTFVLTNFTGFNGQVFDPRFQNQRGALAFANGNVYIPFGGRIGDCRPYEGVVIGVTVSSGAQFHWNTPTNNGAGAWATGGVAVDGSGNVYVATGNTLCPSTFTDYNDSVVKLSSALGPLDYWAPSDWHTLTCNDWDIGSAAPLLIDNGLGFIQGKEATAYIYRQTVMGGIGGEVFSATGCPGRSFGGAAYMAPYIYIPCDNGIVALKVDYAGMKLTTAWSHTGYFGGPPIVAGGAVWIIGGGTLHAYDPVTGMLRYSHAAGSFSTSFPTPGAGDGQIFVADDSTLTSYVLNPTCTQGSSAGSGSGGTTTFYFAEGYTGPGFTECLAMLMPNVSGTATIDYWTQSGHTVGSMAMTAGQVATVNVNQAVGPNAQVSVRVTLPGPGIVERLLDFNFSAWHGSTDIVGVAAPSTTWDFAEGSTLSQFSEFLSLQNPNGSAVLATLTYMTDTGAHPAKTLTLPANSRTTVTVNTGDLSDVSGCIANGVGANCGVGSGIQGVSVSVTTPTGMPIVAERPFYVNGFAFGFNGEAMAIRDGHVAFGANAPATTWYFAEGTTLNGFDEYLTLQNPGLSMATVTLRYVDDLGTVTTKIVTVNAQTRLTVPVFQSASGVGPGVGGVSTQVTSNQPIVAERPMYIDHNFGTGPVAGAHDVLGATGLGTLFGFAAASTVTGYNDYLTLQNPGASNATVRLDYYTGGGIVTHTVTVNANTRVTVPIWDATVGAGTGQSILGVVVTSTNAVPILVEKPTYSSNAPTYGATDTAGHTPPGGF